MNNLIANSNNIHEKSELSNKFFNSNISENFNKKKIFNQPCFIVRKFQNQSLEPLEKNRQKNIFAKKIDSNEIKFNDYNSGPKYSKKGDLIRYSILGDIDNFKKNNSNKNIGDMVCPFQFKTPKAKIYKNPTETDNNSKKNFSRNSSVINSPIKNPRSILKANKNLGSILKKNNFRKNIQTFSRNDLLKGKNHKISKMINIFLHFNKFFYFLLNS